MTGNNKVRSIVLAALVVFSVFAGSIALAGGAAAQADNSLDNGDVVFVGQVVDFTGADGAEGYTLVDNDGDFVREYNSNSFEIDTEELETGSYELRAQGADDTVEFTVAEQDLDAEFEDNELVLDSNRGSYTVEVTSSDADVTEVFSGATETDDGVEFDVPGDGAIEANESALESGEYDFDVQVTDTNANDTATLGVGVTPDADAEFEQSVYEGTRGDVVEIAIDFTGDADDATVTLGSEDVNYQVDLLVEDTDDDGNATIVFNTYNTLEGQSTAFSADEGADVTVQGDEQKLSSILSADAAYDLSASVDDDETDVATLAINEGSIDSFEIGTAPAAAFGDAETVSDVENVSTTTDTIAAGDVVTHRLEATGIFGAVTAAGDLPTFLSQTDAEIVISEVDAGPNADADSISLEDAPSSAYNVVTDGEGVVYVNVDSSALGDDFETGQELIVDLTLTEDTNLVEEETTLNDTFTLVDRTASFDTEEVDDTDTIVVRAEENATITGETSVAPGTEFNVRVRSTGDNPFLLDDDVEATEDGTFEAEFDFSDVSANTTFEASIIGGNFDEADTDVAGVVEPARTAEVSIEDQETDGSSVTVDSATLSEGGFIAIFEGENVSADTLLGVSDYVESGENSDIEVSFEESLSENTTVTAVAHQDTNDNEEIDFVTSNGSEDTPYTTDGDVVSDTAEITIGNASNATASVTIEDQETDGSTVTVASASLPEGGFVTIHDSTLQDGAVIESVRGTSEYLEAGNVSDLSITLDTPYNESGTAIAMPHMDTNDNQEYDFVTSEGSDDGPYTTADGAPLTDSAELTVGDGTGNETTSEPETTTAPETTEETTMAEDTPTDDGTATSEDGPGFGIVVALVALVAAALLAVRRDN